MSNSQYKQLLGIGIGHFHNSTISHVIGKKNLKLRGMLGIC